MLKAARRPSSQPRTRGGSPGALGTGRKKAAYDRVHFATMALESGARRLGITPRAMYRRLKKQDLIRQRLFRHYDLLHTQSLDYVAEDIAETLLNREADAQGNGEKAHTEARRGRGTEEGRAGKSLRGGAEGRRISATKGTKANKGLEEDTGRVKE